MVHLSLSARLCAFDTYIRIYIYVHVIKYMNYIFLYFTGVYIINTSMYAECYCTVVQVLNTCLNVQVSVYFVKCSFITIVT